MAWRRWPPCSKDCPLRTQIARLQAQLFDQLEASGGLNVPVRRPAGERLDQRKLRR
jgi:hypothetical protein